VLPPLATFASDIAPLVASGKISAQHEHRFAGVAQAVEALNAVHVGSNYGKAVVVFQDE
jgi:NADPH-dependent curcumin reductase CurA